MIAKLETEDQCKILRVSGRIDFESALDFEQQINAMIQQDGDCFIIELSEVELLSSAGLRVLLSTAKRVSHRSASLGLAAPSQVVCQVFEISHFNLLFKIFPSVPEAIAALKGLSHSADPVSPASAPAGDLANAKKSSTSKREPPPVPEAVPPPLPAAKAGQPPIPPAPAAETVLPAAQLPPVPKIPAAAPLPSAPETVLPGATHPSAPRISEPVPSPPPLPAAETAQPGARSGSSPQVSQTGGAPLPLPVPETKPSAARASKPPPLEVARSRPPQSPGARQISEPPPSGTETAAPFARSPQPLAIQRTAGPRPRIEAPFPAQLEVRAEGNSYPCKDGDVIGGAGQLGKPYFTQIPGLGPRHLLIGKLEGRWFVFTPQNVQHPFSMDGHLLVAGERKFLDYAEHQLEFNGHVFGLRLVAEQQKRGFFSRIFGKK
jgi:anti-anti-sigma factor